MDDNQTIRNQVVKVVQDYLGPTTERFVDRQIQAHLKKKPNELTKHDLIELTDWLKVSIALLTDDKKLVDAFALSLLDLAKQK